MRTSYPWRVERPVSSAATQTLSTTGRRAGPGHSKLARSRALLGPPPPPPGQPAPLRVTFAEVPPTVLGPGLADESNYLGGRGAGDYSYAYSHQILSPASVITGQAGPAGEANIYEEIQRPPGRDEAGWESDTSAGSDNSFFLSISRGRRRHLQLHRFADWDLGPETAAKVPQEVISEAESGQRRKKMKLEPSAGGKEAESRLVEQLQRLGRRLSRKVSVAFGLDS